MKLIKMQHKHLEMVRQWRNSPHVVEQMFFQTPITREQQETWFSTIPKDDKYWIIVTDKPIGMCSLKNVIKGHQAEGGVFIGEKEYLNSMAAFKAVLQLCDYAFNTLKLQHTLARVKRSNKKALRFNKALGYKEVLGTISPEVILTLSAENYFKQRQKYEHI